MSHALVNEFKLQSVEFIERNTPRIEKCLAVLNEEQVWTKPNEHSNSIANLILHLCGNMTQYIISSVGGADDNRVRSVEFSTQSGYTKAELLDKLKSTVEEATRVVRNCSGEELMRVRTVQGFTYTGMGCILHVTEHYSYHTGQIALLAKIMVNKDLGFYAGYDLNKTGK